MKLIAVLFFVLAAQLSAGVTETAKFFEPTQEDWNTSAPAIVAQQAKYVAAKDAKDYPLARGLALWHFQIMWLYFNEGIALFNEANGNVSVLKEAQNLFAAARDQAGKAKEAGHKKKEWTACLNLLDANEKSIEKEIEVYLNK